MVPEVSQKGKQEFKTESIDFYHLLSPIYEVTMTFDLKNVIITSTSTTEKRQQKLVFSVSLLKADH